MFRLPEFLKREVSDVAAIAAISLVLLTILIWAAIAENWMRSGTVFLRGTIS